MAALLFIGAVGFLFGGFHGAALAIVGAVILLIVLSAIAD